MPQQPRPVHPVVQPEVIADAVFRAAPQPRRDYRIGWSTPQVILGSMLLKGFLDRHLARNAVVAQETSSPVTPGRRDNLTTPVRALHRTRGRFSAEASSRAPVVAGEIARLAPVAAAAVSVFLMTALFARRRWTRL